MITEWIHADWCLGIGKELQNILVTSGKRLITNAVAQGEETLRGHLGGDFLKILEARQERSRLQRSGYLPALVVTLREFENRRQSVLNRLNRAAWDQPENCGQASTTPQPSWGVDVQ